MRRIKRITVLLRPFFTVSLLNVISFRAPEIHLDSIKLIPFHGVFAIQHGIHRLHFFHLDNGVLFLFEVIGNDTQTTVGRVVQLSRIFTRKALNRLLVIKFVFRLDVARTQHAGFTTTMTQHFSFNNRGDIGRHRRFSGNFVQHHLFGVEIHRTAEKQLQKQRTKFNFLFGITE